MRLQCVNQLLAAREDFRQAREVTAQELIDVPGAGELPKAHHAEHVSISEALHRQITDQFEPLFGELLHQQLILWLVLNICQKERQLNSDVLLALRIFG